MEEAREERINIGAILETENRIPMTPLIQQIAITKEDIVPVGVLVRMVFFIEATVCRIFAS